MEVVDLDELEIPPEVIARIPATMAKNYNVVPIKFDGRVLTVAMSNPNDVNVQDDLRSNLRVDIQGAVASEEGVQRALKAEEGIHLLAQQQRGFHLVAQAGHLTLEPVHALAGMAEPGLGGRLGLDDPLDLLFGPGHLAAEPLETGNLPLDFLAAFPKGVEFSGSLQDRGERPQVVGGGFGAGDQRLQRGGNISPARIDGDHRVILAAATFQETDH